MLFVRNLLEQARSQRANGVTGPARTGEALRVSVPPGALDLVATGPKGDKVEASVRSSVAIVPDTHLAGLYQVSWKGARGGSVTVAANLASEAESDLTRAMDPATTKGAAVTPAASRVAGHQDMSWALALAALALLAFDVWWLTRPVKPTGGKSAAKPVQPERGRAKPAVATGSNENKRAA